jgi:cysteine sulfinate desulfinase/cysteine desulfurase-like protein
LNAILQIAQRKIYNGTKLKIVAIIDSIVSIPGVYLPWKDMVALCRERGIVTVVDAAHSLGQEPDINLSDVGPDFWVSVRSIIHRTCTDMLNRALAELSQVALCSSSLCNPLRPKTVC